MNLSISQSIIASICIVSCTILVALGNLSSDAYIAFIGPIAGGALGYVNGKKVGKKEAAVDVATTGAVKEI